MGSKDVQKTEIPPPTEQEQALMQMSLDALMPAYLEEAGYEVTKNTSTWEDSEDAKKFNKKKGELESQIAALQPQPGQMVDKKKAGELTKAQADLDALNAKIQESQSNFKPGTTYQTRKKLSPEVEAVRSQYGENSPEYKAAYDKYQQGQIDTSQKNDEIQKLMLDKTIKFLNGDYSIDDSQKQFINDVMGPMKDAAVNAVKYIQDEASKSDESIGKTIDAFSTQVKQTGLDMGDAILALEDRVKQTGANMKTALNEEVEFSKSLVKMGLEDFTADQRKRLATQAASLGRSASDPDFQMEMQNNVNKEIERTNLQLGQYAAEKKMGIEERTGSGLEDAAKLRLGVAERTGGGLEDAAKMRMGLAERTAGLREGAAQLRGSTEMGLAESEANMRKDISMGLAPQQVGLGMNVGQYQNALMQQKIANAGAAMNAPLNFYNTMAQERYAQPTVTSTHTPGAGEIIGGIVGTGLSALGTAYGVGWLGKGG